MKNNNNVKRAWILIISTIMVSIVLIWVFEKGEALGIAASR
jgi:hypothetical protein